MITFRERCLNAFRVVRNFGINNHAIYRFKFNLLSD